MPLYNFRARRPTGELVEGSRDATTPDELRRLLAGDALLLVDARRTAGGSGFRMPSLALPRRRRGVRLSALVGFVREFRVLVGAGLPMTQTLGLLAQRDDDPRLADAIRGTRAGIEQGLSLDAAAAARPDVFDGLFLATLAAGVKTGRLEDALARLEVFLALRAELQRKARKALTYPVFLLALLAVILAILMLFVLPRFAELYAEFGSDLPAATQLLMMLTRTAPVWIPAAAAGAVLLAWAARAALKNQELRLALTAKLLRAPVLGPILLDLALVRACYLLAMLLGAGMPLREALGFLGQAESNLWVREQFARIGDSIEAGQSLSDAAAGTRLFPPASAGMVRAGEISGQLPDMLIAITKLHEQTLDERMSRLLALIEPLMLLIVGIVLGAVIVAVYLPIFGISSVVQ